jgi:Uncharacterised protein family (UPF0158)
MRKLNIEMSDLEMAFDSSGEMTNYYLDIETGDVLSITDEDNRLLEQRSENYYDEETRAMDWEKAFQEKTIPEWQRDMLLKADQIEANFSSRYIAIPSAEAGEGYRDMEAFIPTVCNPHLQERLDRAISGRGAFRYFKDVLLEYPKEREHWFHFKQERLQQRILDWLEAEEIEISHK